MKKTILTTIALAMTLGIMTAFAGCGSNSPGNKVIDILSLMGKGDWAGVYDRLHKFSRYTEDKNEFSLQMAEYAKPLTEFLKDAKFEVESEQFEKEWAFEGTKFVDVTRVTVKMAPGQTKDWPTDFPFAVNLGQTLRCEFVYDAKKDTEGVIINLGKPPMVHWVWASRDKGDYAAVAPDFVVSDPDPEKTGSPAVASFYWVFDNNYKGKYYAVPLEAYTKILVVAIDPENGSVKFVKQVAPPPMETEKAFMDSIFKPYETQVVNADTIASMMLMAVIEPTYIPYAKEVRAAVAQVLKLYTIHKLRGYGAFHSKYPAGLLAIRKGIKLELPPFKDTKDIMINRNGFLAKGKTAIIRVSSCGSCQGTALDVMKQLKLFGLTEDRIVFISSSPLNKLGDFPKRIGSAHLVIDDKNFIQIPLRLMTTPSMVILDKESKVLAFLESNDIENTNTFRTALNAAFR